MTICSLWPISNVLEIGLHDFIRIGQYNRSSLIDCHVYHLYLDMYYIGPSSICPATANHWVRSALQCLFALTVTPSLLQSFSITSPDCISLSRAVCCCRPEVYFVAGGGTYTVFSEWLVRLKWQTHDAQIGLLDCQHSSWLHGLLGVAVAVQWHLHSLLWVARKARVADAWCTDWVAWLPTFILSWCRLRLAGILRFICKTQTGGEDEVTWKFNRISAA